MYRTPLTTAASLALLVTMLAAASGCTTQAGAAPATSATSATPATSAAVSAVARPASVATGIDMAPQAPFDTTVITPVESAGASPAP